MALSYVFPSGYNGFIPTVNGKAGAGLIVEFSRAPDRFHLNKYTQLFQVQLESGKYWRFDQNAMARINTGDGSQYIWADGADRPAQNIFQGFELPAYNCTRLNFGFQLGDLATYHAQKAGGVDLEAVNSKTAAAASMLQRTRKALVRARDLTTMQWYNANSSYNTALNVTANGTTNGITGNWSAPSVTPIGLTQGNYWDKGYYAAGGNANANTYLRSAINTILATIVQNSNGMVQPQDINIVMGPDTAIALGQSAEVTDFLKQSPIAERNLMQDGQYAQYGVPKNLFGASQVIVEDASYISAHPFGSNTPTRSWVLPLGTVVFLSRPGGIEGSMMSYSTLMGFFLEEMTVEVFDRPEHRYVQGNVVDNYDYQITAPITGFVALHVISGS